MKKYLKNIGVNSRIAFKNLNKVSFKKRNKIIDIYNKELGKNKNRIISENAKDLRNCKRQDLIDRLILDRNKIESIRNSLNEIKNFKNPLEKIITKWKRPNGCIIKKV